MSQAEEAAAAVAIIVTQSLRHPSRPLRLHDDITKEMAVDLALAALRCVVSGVDRIAALSQQTPESIWQDACLRFATQRGDQ